MEVSTHFEQGPSFEGEPPSKETNFIDLSSVALQLESIIEGQQFKIMTMEACDSQVRKETTGAQDSTKVSPSDVLQTSLKIHPGPYSCPECPKSFSKRGKYLRHMLVHQDVRPFRCDSCIKTFRRKDNMNRHVRSVHVRKEFLKQLRQEKNPRSKFRKKKGKAEANRNGNPQGLKGLAFQLAVTRI